jgi:3-oxoacyl-[acyl-carrier protein] reductase
MISLMGKRALVTGGSRGIGAATAMLLAECGANVGIGYHSREREAADVVRQAAALGVRAFAHSADISTSAGAEALFERTAREFGGVDIFVANAGVWPVEDVSISELPESRWEFTMRQNVASMYYTGRAAARAVADGGRMVFVSSTAGQRGEAYHSDYAASKGATISFVKSLAVELAPRNVTVNSVAPGWVDTEMCVEPFANGGRERIEAAIPLRRVASPRDVAGPIVFLCSDLARHVTGEILNVNGGSVLCG